MPNIFVSIINFNGEKDTLDCLDSLDKLNTQGFKLNVVVIDNGSEEVFETIKKYENFDLKIIRSKKNLGFAGGQNMGIKYSLENSADYVLVLNNDVILDKDLIFELYNTFTLKKDAGILSPKIYFAKGHEFHKDRYLDKDLGKVIWYAGGIMDFKNLIGHHKGVDEVDKGQYNDLQDTDFASGCCMLIKKDVFKTVGLFNEKYFLYYEDTDLSFRAKKKGFKVYYQPKAILWHINAGSQGGTGSDLQDYYITRNRLIFGSKYASKRVKLALFRESLSLFSNGRKWQKKAIKDYYLGKFYKGSYE